MIRITINKKDNLVNNIKISGHSGYEESGKDIVCASVSCIAITSVNAIIKIDSEAIIYIEDDGLLDIKVLKHNEIIDTLIRNMIDLLKELKENYSEFIIID